MSGTKTPPTVVLAGVPGSDVVRARPLLERSGFKVVVTEEPEALSALEKAGSPPDLVIVDMGFGEDGGVGCCRRLRTEPFWRSVSLMLVVPTGEQHLEECVVSGINDFILAPFPDDELVNRVNRLTIIPARREMNTLARLTEVRQGGGTYMGKTLNVSVNGVLLEVENILSVGRVVELEFFLPNDPVSVRSRGQVTRRANEIDVFHPSFGVRFLELGASDRKRIELFVAERERTAAKPPGRVSR